DRNANPRKCSVEGCGKGHAAKGFCGTHYARLRSTGTAESPFALECEHCATPLPPVSKHTSVRKYCSNLCGAKASYLRRRDRLNAERRAESAAARALVVRECPECGSEFSPERTLAQVYCTKICSRNATRW